MALQRNEGLGRHRLVDTRDNDSYIDDERANIPDTMLASAGRRDRVQLIKMVERTSKYRRGPELHGHQ